MKYHFEEVLEGLPEELLCGVKVSLTPETEEDQRFLNYIECWTIEGTIRFASSHHMGGQPNCGGATLNITRDNTGKF